MNSNQNASPSQFDVRKYGLYMQWNEEGPSNLIEEFINQTPILLSELEQLLADGRMREASRVIHKLKSSVGLFCTDNLYRDIQELEKTVVHIISPVFHNEGRKVIERVGLLMSELSQVAQTPAKSP